MTKTKSFIASRYSDAELLEFKQLIEIKLGKAEVQLENLQSTLSETTASKDGEGDWMDDTSTDNDIQLLEVMIGRQRKHILDLTNALQRIRNKSYGICMVSGQLIDKRRLKAVLTTTKSLEAKIAIEKPTKKQKEEVDEDSDIKKTPSRLIPTERKIITRVIKRVGGPEKETVINKEEIEDEDMDDLYMDYDDESVDFDSLSDEDLD